MQKELDKMNQRGYKSFEELHQFIYPIIKEYTVTVPLLEGNQQVPTVSLFDHLKLLYELNFLTFYVTFLFFIF